VGVNQIPIILTLQNKCDQINGNFLNFLKAFVPVNSQHAVWLVGTDVLEKHTAPFRKCWHIHNKPHGTTTCKTLIRGFNLRSSPTKHKKSHTTASVHKVVHPYSIFQSPHVSVIQHPLEPCSSRGTEFNGKCTYPVKCGAPRNFLLPHSRAKRMPTFRVSSDRKQ